jgi:gluconokinase
MNELVILVMGVSGSGKTTIGRRLAGALDLPFFDGDDLHPKSNLAKMAAGVPLTDADRWPWLDRIRDLIGSLVRDDQPAVIAASMLKRAYRQYVDWTDQVTYVYLRGEPELIRKRMRQRGGHFMRAGMLDSQYAVLEPPADAIAVDVARSPSAIVDSIVARLESDNGSE